MQREFNFLNRISITTCFITCQSPTFRKIIKERKKLIKFFLRYRIILMIMTSSTSNGKAQPSLAGGINPIDHILNTPLFCNQAAFTIKPMVSIKTCCNDLRFGCIREHITSNLLNGKLIKWHIFIVGIDDPISPGPHTST